MTKKEQIISIAIHLFATQGYENTSIQKLAEVAGVAQGLLYRHFKNKYDLLIHISHIGIAQIKHTLQPYSNLTYSFTEALKQHISLTCGYLVANRDLWKVIHSARLQGILASPHDADSMIHELVLKPMISKLTDAGYKEPEMHAWYIFSLIDGMTSLYLAHPEIYPLTKIEHFLTNKAADL